SPTTSFPNLHSLYYIYPPPCHSAPSRRISYYNFFSPFKVRDVSPPLDMTKKINLAILFAVVSIYSLTAQESAIPSLTAPESRSPTLTPLASPSPTSSPTRSVRISFVPPPLEGTISLGIYDGNGRLVRILHQQADLNEFTICADALVTKWDGKNDDGEDLPAGKYHARGYVV